MRTKLFILLIMLLSLSAAIHAAGGLTIADASIKLGEEANLSLSIAIETEKYAGLQFDITLPEGVFLENNTSGKPYTLSGSQTNDLSCDIKDLGSSGYRFVIYSKSLKTFKNGSLMSLHIKAHSTVGLGNYSLLLSNIVFSDDNGNVTKISNRTATIKVFDIFTLTYIVDGEAYKTVSYEYGSNIIPEAVLTKEGYTFSGWSNIPATMPAQDVTVTGTFTINKYNLIYKIDGENYKTFEIEYGTAITPEAVPIKEGYTFSGWSEIPSKMPAHDVTITGTFSVNKFKLTYKVDGADYKTYEIEYGKSISPEAEPTKEGYTFSGWSEIPSTMPAKDVTVTGTFTVNKYKLTYLVDGKSYKVYEIEYGTTITPEAAPTKDNYIFSGWSDIPQTMPANDVTVTGTFTYVPPTAYILTYKVDGEVYKTASHYEGDAITPEAAPTKEGYTFSGWSEIPSTMPAQDVTVTGTFTINKYNLIYKVDGENYKSYEIEYGTAITPEAVPIKEGYTFSGWSEIPSTMPANDVTVIGTFTVNKYKLTYMVDGVEYKSYQIEFGATITPEAEPTKDGYIFSGWGPIPATMPAKDVTVAGTFSKGVYKLIYQVDGKPYKTISYNYGDAITPEATPTKEGYTFSGWSEVPSTMPANDVTVTGTFTINKFKVTYWVDGVEYKSFQIEYGAKITPEPEPAKEGYTFSGWDSIPETMPAKDVTITGTFSKGAYKLTYQVDGVTYKTISYDYGDAITPEASPTKEGYTFSGWSEIPSTMPAKDVTVTGTFTINKYRLTYIVDGAEYKSSEIEYGTTITSEAEPTKEGYTFSGWNEIPSTMPAKDVTVTGTFTINKYKVTYIIDGEIYLTEEVEYGSTITPPTPSDHDGYDFAWDDHPDTMPAENITIYGTYTATGIKAIMANKSDMKIFTVSGKPLNKLQKGVNILRTKDGKTKKVMVK